MDNSLNGGPQSARIKPLKRLKKDSNQKFIFCCQFIVYDTQIILGEGKVKLSEDEYILAVIILYVDLITLFKLILSLLNDE